MPRSHDGLLLLCLATVYIVWGSTFYAIIPALTGFPPLLLSGFRYAAAGLVLFAWCLFRRAPLPKPREWAGAALVGFLLLTGGTGTVAIAEQSVSSSMAAIVIATVPLCAALLGRCFGERVRLGQWLGLSIGLCGVLLIKMGGELVMSDARGAWLLCAPISWALGMVLARRVRLPAGAMAVAAQLLCAAAFSLTLGFATGERLSSVPPIRAVIALGYLSVFGSIVGFGAFSYLLRNAPPLLASSYAYVNPLVAMLLGVGLNDEKLGPATLWGATVILIGVATLNLTSAAPGSSASIPGSSKVSRA